MGGERYRGRHELLCGEPEKALSSFRAAERVFPTDSTLKILIAQTLLRMRPQRYDEAIRALELAVDIDPRNFGARRALYACYEETGRRQQAIKHLRVAREINPNDAYIQQHATVLDEEENPAAGIVRRERLREENPQDAANLLRLAELYAQPAVNNMETARQRLLEALEADPSNTEVARFGVRFFSDRQDREGGERFLLRHLESQEGRGEIFARVLLGRFYNSIGDAEAAQRVFQQARQSVDRVLADDTEDNRRNAMVLVMSETGRFYRDARRYEEMIDAYRVVLSHCRPNDIASIQSARQNITLGLMALREYGDAEEEIASYRREFPDDLQGMLQEAELLFARHKLDEAKEVLSEVLERNPDNPFARYMRGQVAIRMNRYSEAREDLLHAKTVAPLAFELAHRLDLARLYELMEQPQLAEAELRELLPLPRGSGHDVELRLIRLLQATGQYQRAQSFVNELRAREPQEPAWPYQLGRLLIAQGEFAAAATHLAEAAELTDYRNTEVVTELMSALVRGNRAQEATSAYNRLDSRSITPVIQTYAAEAYLAQGQRDVAVALLEQAVHAGSVGHASAVLQVATRSVGLLGKDETVALLRRVLEQAANPSADLALRAVLAQYLASDDDPARRAEGLELTEQVINDAAEDDPLRWHAMRIRAAALDQIGQSEQAVEIYEEILRLLPNDTRVLNNLAYMLADKLDRAAEALPYAERLEEVAPEQNRPVFLDTVGWVYHKAGKNDRAEAVFLEALRITPDYLAARYHLGMVHLSAGNRTAAERAFRRVLERANELDDEDYVQKAEEALEQLRR